MSRDSNGTYSLPAGNPVSNGTTISATWANTTLTDLGNELSNSMDKGGRTTPTANLKMGGFKFTGLAAGSVAGDSVRFEQANVIGETTVTGHATTADIFAAPTERVLFDGTGLVVTAFPASALNTSKLVRFNGVNTLVHSSSLQLPADANFVTESGDVALLISVGSDTQVVNIFPTAGPQYALSFVRAAVSANTIASGDYAQVWNWQVTTASKIGFRIGESAASTGAGASLLAVVNESGSTARPFVAQWTGLTNGQIGFTTAGQAQLVAPSLTGSVGLEAIVTGGPSGTTTGTGGDVLITAGDGGSTSGAGGDVVITGGDSSSVLGGDVILLPGVGSAGTDGDIELRSRLESTPAASLLVVGGNGHVHLPTPALSTYGPSVTSGGGTGVAISGSDNLFRITLGTSPSTTAIVIAFNAAWAAAPAVFPQAHAGDIFEVDVTTTTVTLTPLSTLNAGTAIDVLCLGF